MQRLIDIPEFQRLRHIRQNGVSNLVFQGAEHSRFSHSMGVAHLAGEMYAHVCRNMGESEDQQHLLATRVAALLHDVGHGPFSHTLEEILKAQKVKFDHEKMTQRLILDSSIRTVLDSVDSGLAVDVSSYISKKRAEDKDHWRYKLVSSQLDADRLDYLLRDAAAVGLRGHSYDLVRLLDMLHHVEGKSIAVHRRGLETVEGYLVAIDQIYRAVYYHHTIRAASFLLSSVLRRAGELLNNGNQGIVPEGHPFKEVLLKGDSCDLQSYIRLGEYHIWTLIESWQFGSEPILADLSRRLMSRNLFKTYDLDLERLGLEEAEEIKKEAQRLVTIEVSGCTDAVKSLYADTDDPSRVSYKLYDFKADRPDESIWIREDDGKSMPIERHPGTKIIDGLKSVRRFSRLIFAPEIRDSLFRFIDERKRR